REFAQHLAPHAGIVERAACRDVELALDEAAAQDLDAALVEGLVGNHQRVVDRVVLIGHAAACASTGTRPPWRPRPLRRPMAAPASPGSPHTASAHPCRTRPRPARRASRTRSP